MKQTNENGLTPLKQRKADTLARMNSVDGRAPDTDTQRAMESKMRGGGKRLRRQGAALLLAAGATTAVGAGINSIPEEPTPDSAQSIEVSNDTVSFVAGEEYGSGDDPIEIGSYWDAARAALEAGGYEHPSGAQVNALLNTYEERRQATDPDFNLGNQVLQASQLVEMPEVLPPNGS